MNPARSRLFLSSCLAAGFLGSGTLSAADDVTPAQRYQQDRAACTSGRSHQDRQTCLREAGAALQESRRNGLTEPDRATLEQNQLARCGSFQGQERQWCERRMREGTTTGSVEGGGVLRELVVTVPAS
jgi:hypothetical protein